MHRKWLKNSLFEGVLAICGALFLSQPLRQVRSLRQHAHGPRLHNESGGKIGDAFAVGPDREWSICGHMDLSRTFLEHSGQGDVGAVEYAKQDRDHQRDRAPLQSIHLQEAIVEGGTSADPQASADRLRVSDRDVPRAEDPSDAVDSDRQIRGPERQQ